MSLPRAVFFDCDGTICLTDHMHFDLWQKALEELDLDFTKKTGHVVDIEWYRANISGLHNPIICENLFACEKTWPLLDTPEKRVNIGLRKEELFREELEKVSVEECRTPGLPELLAQLDKASVPHFVVTNAPRLNLLAMVSAIGEADRFVGDLIVIGDEVERAKPDPCAYLVAMQRASAILEARGEKPLKPEECVVFEDSPGGICAGVAAGMRVVAVRGGHPDEALEKHGASTLIDNFVNFSF
eukprot:TRINITY_DN6210_c0_g1_i1.p1 TRINITY_DN6210_c0_g1~~TRINITY_DN6210_c0_g1_i1.p1  ORF type:complete len:243 (-),score=49.39 TRINITY_DN6210_c0_g1_i1:15-743(-)